MNGSAVTFLHLVKLINAADALVSKDQSPALKHLHRLSELSEEKADKHIHLMYCTARSCF